MKSKYQTNTINFPTIINTFIILLIILLFFVLDSKITDIFTKLNATFSIFFFAISIFSFYLIKKKELGGAFINFIVIPILIFLFIIGFLSISNLFPKGTDDFSICLYSISILFMLIPFIRNLIFNFKSIDIKNKMVLKTNELSYNNKLIIGVGICLTFFRTIDFINENSLFRCLRLLFIPCFFFLIYYNKKDYIQINNNLLFNSINNKHYNLCDIKHIFICDNCIEITLNSEELVKLKYFQISDDKMIEIKDYIQKNSSIIVD